MLKVKPQIKHTCILKFFGSTLLPNFIAIGMLLGMLPFVPLLTSDVILYYRFNGPNYSPIGWSRLNHSSTHRNIASQSISRPDAITLKSSYAIRLTDLIGL